MSERHRLHETQIARFGVEPAGAYSVEPLDSPDGVAVIALAGELDIAAAPSVRACVDASAGRRAVVLDLSGATFVDSSMLKELLRANAELERYDTRLVLAGMTPAVRRVFELTRTTALFTVAETPGAAVALASSDGAAADGASAGGP